MERVCLNCKKTSAKSFEKDDITRWFCDKNCQTQHYSLVEGQGSSRTLAPSVNKLQEYFFDELKQRRKNGNFYLKEIWGVRRVAHVTLKNGCNILLFGENHEFSKEDYLNEDVKSVELNIFEKSEFTGNSNYQMSMTRFLFAMMAKLVKNRQYADMFIEISPYNVWGVKYDHGASGLHLAEHMFRHFNCNKPGECAFHPFVKIHYSDLRFQIQIDKEYPLLHELIVSFVSFICDKRRLPRSSEHLTLINMLLYFIQNFFTSLQKNNQSWALNFFDIVWSEDTTNAYESWVLEPFLYLSMRLRKIDEQLLSKDFNEEYQHYDKQVYKQYIDSIIGYFKKDDDNLRWKRVLKTKKQLVGVDADVAKVLIQSAKTELQMSSLKLAKDIVVEGDYKYFDPTLLSYVNDLKNLDGTKIIEVFASVQIWEMDLYVLFRLFKSFNYEKKSNLKIIYTGDGHIRNYINYLQNGDFLKSVKFIDTSPDLDPEKFFVFNDYKYTRDDKYTVLSDTGAEYLNSLI